MSYVKPGVYIQEKFVGGGVAAGGFTIPVVVGKGLKEKRAWDEEVERGRYEETLVPTVGGDLTLTYQSTQKKSESHIYKNGVELPEDAYTFISATVVNIVLAYRDITATWKFSYLATNYYLDSLDNTPAEIIYVSKSPGGARSYRTGVDWQLTTNKIDWSLLAAATLTGSVVEPYNLTTDSRIKISVDGKTPIEVIITGAVQSAVTAAEVVADINAAALAAWGASYGTIASVDVARVKLTSVVLGEAGTINFYTPTTADATDNIFGVTAPAYYKGIGVRPSIGQIYYVRYDYTKVVADYDVVKLFYRYDDAMTELGPITRDNDLLIAIGVAFQNGAQIVAGVQVQDPDNDGIYMYADWTRALDAVKASSEVTDLVLLNSNTDIMGYAVGVVEDEASLYRNHWMGGWFGVTSGTLIGNPDTSGTIAYIAKKTLQVGGSSPARGRFILVAPDDVKYQITETDTRLTLELTLDSTFIAAALAGLQASLPVISDSLLRRQVQGFIPSSITLTEAEASYLASAGVFTVVNVGGRLICFDPVTTDAGGDELYVEPNIRPQKDYLASRIRNRLDSYVIGIVPDDVNDFVYELKSQIALEIEAAVADKVIATYRDDQSRTRELNIDTDIKVYQSQVKKTEYRFMYWFQAKWTVKRIYGEYLVDTPII